MNDEEIINKMIDKSIESFLLGIEIYNKPTIKYRTESFAFHICNAWELMLKAYLIKTKGKDSIIIKEDRSISFSNALKKVFKSNNPIYLNLKKVSEIRNQSIHYIIPEYDEVNYSLFQASVFNYCNFMIMNLNTNVYQYTEIDIFILLRPNRKKNLVNTDKYDKETLEKYNNYKNDIERLKDEIDSNKFSTDIYISLEHGSKVHLDVNSNNKVAPEDVFKLFPYNQKIAIKKINSKLNKKGIDYILNQNGLTVLNNHYKLKEEGTYYYKIDDPTGKGNYSYRCNDNLIKFIIKLINDNNNIISEIRKQNKKNDSSKGNEL